MSPSMKVGSLLHMMKIPLLASVLPLSLFNLAFANNKIDSHGFCSKPAHLLRGTMKVNGENHVEIGGVDVVPLMQKSEFPIYIIDEKLVRDNMSAYVTSVKQFYPNPGPVFYASKALMTLAMCKIAEKQGMGLDVSTKGELFTAMKADFPMERVLLHGNNKSEEEIELALKSGVGRIVVDNLDDLELLNGASKRLNKVVHILIRVKPGIYAHTDHHIATGNNESKFGFIIDNGAAEVAISKALEYPHLKFDGLHVHIGSQILEMDDFTKAIDLVAAFMKKLQTKGIDIKELDLGGGLGTVYTCKDTKIEIADYIKTITSHLISKATEFGLPLPKLMLEPGRSIIAEAGTTIYKIGSTKTVDNGQLYAAVNGGMSDNIRPALYQAKYHAVLANRMNEALTTDTKIVGKSCESGDVLIEQIRLPKPVRGDTLAVFTTGAYNYSMASNYNRLPVPGVLLVNAGKSDWIVEPQGMDDILRYDVVPKRLK